MDKKNREENWVESISLNEAMQRLDEREKQIIRLRFYEGRTQMEVASEIGISQAQVSRLEKNALKCMQELSDRLITAQRWYLFAFFSAVLLLDVNEDDIASDLDDTPPWDHVFKIASEKPAQAAGTRDDDGKHAAGAAVDLQIRDTAKGTAGANIDDLLLPAVHTDGRAAAFHSHSRAQN